MTDRLALLAASLGAPGDGAPRATVMAPLIDAEGPAGTWLTLAVLTGQLPVDDEVVAARRRAGIAGTDAWLDELLERVGRQLTRPGPRPPRVTVVTGAVVVDVHHTAATGLATGIQRVSREATRRWSRTHDLVLVGWTPSFRAMRPLSPGEAARAMGAPAATEVTHDVAHDVVVPWRCTVVLPELAVEDDRTTRLLALARSGAVATGAIGFDCVPITSPETADEGMTAAFARTLAAVREFDVVATISEAAAVEYRGWRDMVRAAGHAGPEIVAVPLAEEPVPPGATDPVELLERIAPGDGALVLTVGSHEPRKNHLAVLHAAERLWSEGVRFRLLFVGGNAWHSDRFTAELLRLQSAGRPVSSVSAVSDDDLAALYRAARCVAFPSLNEGFGLPVAEALAVGTPVLTSDVGSTRDLASGGGAVGVDPRDDDAVTSGLRRLLTDDALHDRLSSQARARPGRTWDDYAREVWSALVDGPPVVASVQSPHGR